MRRIVTPLALCSTLLLAACGSSSSSTPPPPPPTPPARNLWIAPDAAASFDPTTRAAFLSGGLYVNAHTAAHGSGEIRGQLDEGGTARLATLDGTQEGVTSSAYGAGVFTVEETTGTIRGFVITSGLTDVTAAHIHPGARGATGGPIVPLSGGPFLWYVPDDAAALTAPQITAFLGGGLYVNVHTAAHPSGEIRGQLDKGGTVKLAALDGAQETPAPGVTTTGFGTGIFGIDETSGAVRGFLLTSGLVSETAAHLHPGARGAAGGPVVALSGGAGLWVVPDAAADLTAPQVALFQTGDLYVNAHTTAHGSGEIRGQLDKTGALRLVALVGSQETPAVTTTAFGASAVQVDDATGQVSGFIVTSGLVSPTVAHIHAGAAGASGGPVQALTGP